MKTRSMKSAVYAAGVVFAPSEDEPSTTAIPRMKSRVKRRHKDAVAAYDAKFIEANPAQAPANNWLSILSFGWLVGRAPA